MTLDALILGTIEGEETVLSYLDSLSNAALEDLFRPIFNVTRPEKSLASKRPTNPIDNRGVPTRIKRGAGRRSATVEDKLAGLSADKKALLEGLL